LWQLPEFGVRSHRALFMWWKQRSVQYSIALSAMQPKQVEWLFLQGSRQEGRDQLL
jgi:hypothetical protein